MNQNEVDEIDRLQRAANLRYVNLHRADLKGADLKGALGFPFNINEGESDEPERT